MKHPSNKSFFPLLLLLTWIILLPCSNAFAQGIKDSCQNKKSLKAFENARSFFDLGEYPKCEEELKKAIEGCPSFTDAHILLGDLYVETARLPEGAGAYREALRNRPEKPEVVMGLLANTLFDMERYGEASRYFDSILSRQGINPEWRSILLKRQSVARFRQEQMDHPVAFSPVSLGMGVNTPGDEYINALSPDEEQVIFTRRTKIGTAQEGRGRQFREDFYESVKLDGAWSEAQLMQNPVPPGGDAGGLSRSPDGRKIWFTACFREDGIGSCDIYFTEKVGDTWLPPKNMGPVVNSDQWDSQPSISPDGKTLYFASNRRGGQGSSDIWKTELDEKGEWGRPVNLGAIVNTSLAEMGPFIHYDNSALYFSSQGHPGMGGADLFLSKRYDGGWTEPLNAGYPINTIADEIVILINPSGSKGYISSDLSSGQGGYDIYEFELAGRIMPVPVTYFRGKVFDRNSQAPLEAFFELTDLGSDSVVMSARSDRLKGDFLVCLPSDKDYALNVSCPGYLFYSDHFQLKGVRTSLDPFNLDIPMSPLEAGEKIILRNIFYETDRYVLLEESVVELNKLLEFLKDNPSLAIEIGGHTDNIGSASYNLDLSLRRASEVYSYLIGHGIPEERLSYNGYGYTEPVASNDTEEGRAMNRRTEIRITAL